MQFLSTIKKKVQQRTNLKIIILLLLASQVIYFCMMLVTFPIIEANSQGVRAPDLVPTGYSYEYIQTFISTLSPHSKNIYLFLQLPLDILYPFLLSLFFMFTIARLTTEKSNLLFLGLLICLFDYLENIFIAGILLNPSFSGLWVQIASLFTLLKSVSTSLCYIIVILLLIKKAATIVRGKKYAK